MAELSSPYNVHSLGTKIRNILGNKAKQNKTKTKNK
jgi:hypothetical protein